MINVEFFEDDKSEEEEIAEYQKLINSGDAWLLEGSVGRYAMDLIRAGYCMLGKEGHRDFWGNYVPSRFEVEAGTMGSVEYCEMKDAQR